LVLHKALSAGQLWLSHHLTCDRDVIQCQQVSLP